eukprot:XP_008671778.1 uncharacterized protein LOC103649243 [Zea mays]
MCPDLITAVVISIFAVYAWTKYLATLWKVPYLFRGSPKQTKIRSIVQGYASFYNQPAVHLGRRGRFPSRRIRSDPLDSPAAPPTSKEAQLDGNVVTDLPSDPILHNMRTRRVQAASMGISESRQKQVYLISLINKGRVVVKGKLVTTDSQR